MYSKATLARKYLAYYLKASNGKGHGVHSPFVYSFIREVLLKASSVHRPEIEACRKKLLSNTTLINVVDFGAGSTVLSSATRQVSKMAASSLKPKKYSRLLHQLVGWLQPQQILELGTSFGITTAYLATAHGRCQVTTLEGSPEIAAIARKNFSELALSNIQLIEGNFDDTLAGVLSNISAVDFAFFDGNHQYEPTVRYFKQVLPYLHHSSVIVLDDIHWSAEMEQAWHSLRQHPGVTLSIDLFFIGILFFDPSFRENQHFIIRY